jgi:uncharacterized membrane protein YeaQ/YmgE (transglycosylase-associated protein family)
VLLILLAVLVVLFVILPIVGMALWALVTTVIVGLIIGGLGRLVVPGPTRIGFLATVVAGLCGSIIGGFLGQHALHVGRFATVLLEIAVSAVVVFVMAGGRRQRVTR